MRETIVIGVAQWLPEPGAEADNLDTALGYIAQLGRECDLVALPELWPCGYDVESLPDDVRQCAQPLDGERTRALGQAAASSGVWLAAGTVPELADDSYFNTALLFAPDGSMRAFHRKVHLYQATSEERCFTPGDRLTVCSTHDLGVVGLSVCFDGDFPEVARAMRNKGARVVINAAAYEHSAESWWDRLYPAHALANGQWWILANQAGTRAGTSFSGRSRVIAPSGDVVAEARRSAPLATNGDDVLIAEIPLRSALAEADRSSACLLSSLRTDVAVIEC